MPCHGSQIVTMDAMWYDLNNQQHLIDNWEVVTSEWRTETHGSEG